MSIGKRLSEFEKGQIVAMLDEKKTISYIADKMGRSRTVISNFAKNKDGYGKSTSPGRPSSTSPRIKKAIIKAAKGKSVTANQIKAHLNLKVSRDTVLRVLNSSTTLKRLKYKKKPLLTSSHKTSRIEFCRFNMDKGEKWKNVIFSDEKKFNLDGPDGYSYYWHDVSSKSNYLSRDVHKKDSIMIWGAFSFYGTSNLAFIKENINARVYKKVLNDNLLPYIRSLDLDSVIFQQDNARPHIAEPTLTWLESKGIDLLDWPPYSPDLNPIENLWGILVQRVYANGRCFANIDQLMETIEYEWKNIDKKILEKLSMSMKDRMFDVMLNGGGNTKY